MSVDLSASSIRSLEVLGFDHVNLSHLSDIETKKLILWLEETKIRLLAPSERSELRKITSGEHEQWVKSLWDVS